MSALVSSLTGTVIESAFNHFAHPVNWPDAGSGLAAYILTKSNLPLPDGLRVSPRSVEAAAFRRTPELAAFGYYIALNATDDGLSQEWARGYTRLRGRQIITPDRNSFFFNSVELLGVAVGAASCVRVDESDRQWLLNHVRQGFVDHLFIGLSSELLAVCAARVLGDLSISGPLFSKPIATPAELEIYELCLLITIATFLPGVLKTEHLLNVNDLERELVKRTLSHPVSIRDAIDAVTLYVALTNAVEHSLLSSGPNIGSVSTISALCRRFQLFADRLRTRQRSRPPLEITDEYDVQDLLHAILRLHFDDVREEEWTPSYAGNASRVDFYLPREQMIVEAKMTRRGLGQREVADELIIDKERYSNMEKVRDLVCFVYDPERRCRNPTALEGDLQEDSDRLRTTVIVCPRGL
jgi:hypothetical protein